ncbi:exodeoxyribonuclease I [Bradyrhizobium brasilense]|uniref:Exodeoxyribonuclease I n=1 Tax=Bradyrhizobium brasilense TaxID=1419277 RepID=A0ABY8JLY5_9BRAD|nr:exodeoxyribonuclease I [Bradyrhizobium brasilense]WFU65809.1 exodeoxyribonuclease I [Bradyrhizobium brasilense]
MHFAAIRTDWNLNEIDRFQVRSRLLPHVVPHPSALCTNGLPIARLLDKTLPAHYDMVRSIRRTLLSWSPSIFVGYNSIRFDEEMLRHALFQTLHDAYLTSKHGNSRADALSLVMAATTLSPTCLAVPRNAEGRPIYRLEGLAAANGIAHGDAHDAMGDVAATLELCRMVYDRSSELWQRFVRFSKKATVAEFVESEEGFILTEFYANEAYHAPVVCIGKDPDQPNGRLCLRLDCGIDRLAAMSEQELRAELSIKPSPIRRLRINAAPTLTPLFEASDLMLRGIALETIESTSRRIKEDQSLRERLVAAFIAGRTERPRSLIVEEQLYDAFPGPNDEARMAAFHNVTWPEALSIALSFNDLRLRAFGLRLIYFGSRSSLPRELRAEIERLLIDRLLSEAAGALTLGQAIEALDTIVVESRTGTDALLADYRVHLNDRLTRVTQYQSQHLVA